MKWTKMLFTREKNSETKSLSTELDDITENVKSIFKDIESNKKVLKSLFGETIDFVIDDVQLGKRKGMICYFNTTININLLTDVVYKPIQHSNEINLNDGIEKLEEVVFSGLPVAVTDTYRDIIKNLLSGHIVIFIESFTKVLSIQVADVEERSITEPTSQTVIRGPKDGFVESIHTNLSLIRRRVKSQYLRFESMTVGDDTLTSVAICYLENITNEDILNDVRKRLNGMKVKGVFDSGVVEELITDHPYSPFPLMFSSERPDTVASHLIEGKVAIVVDGSPFVLSAPTVFVDFYHTTEDYTNKYFFASFIRIISYVAFFMSLTLSALYIAFTTFHYELIPTLLLVSFQVQSDGVPFPAVIEILMMELTYEILREAGTRMPRAIGPTISIVGTLVIGQAAVEAGVVSSFVLIIVALSAISSFISTDYTFSASLKLLRFFLIIMAGFLGLYGILWGWFIISIHMVSLKSFGVPYASPIAPFILQDHKDAVLRLPNFKTVTRPSYMKTKKTNGNKSQDGSSSMKEGDNWS
ncbi:spore germination protein [Jeotgalibacillus marinus]|uniref:Spore germination protein n=1 Tax=Jeotgalibacillus marinus TaxID=86667 RepID=A0ABV3Q523_9BACL